jgi:uncharacterized membrane protein YoaK (UPF0700 family)
MLLALTVVTGVVDAVSYLELGHVFVANMTGNVVFLGFALAGAGGISAARSLVALASFLAGAYFGGLLGARQAAHRARLLRATSALQVALLAGALLLSLLSSEPLEGGARYALLVALALAMGLQNAGAQRLAVPDLTTTVLTRTLTGLASAVGGAGAGEDDSLGLLVRRLLAVTAMLAGALAGGLLALHRSVAAALILATALVLAVALVAHALAPSSQPWTRG